MKTLITFILAAWCTISVAKEIKVIIPYSAGGPTDRVTRTVLKHLNTDQYKFIPEYKLGAGGSIAANYVSAVKEETVLMITSNALVSSPILTTTTTYNLEKDFLLLDYLGTEPLFLAVKNDSNIKNFKDFVATGKTNNMPYGSAGVGTSGHIGSAIIAQNNTNYQHIPYKGSSGIVIDLLNGQLKWILDSEMNIGQFLADGQVRSIAVLSNKRLPTYPTLPTIKELGVDDKGFYRWHILVANRAADPDVIKYVLSRLQDPALRNDLVKLGLDTSKPKLENFFLNESVKIRRIVRDFDIK